MQLTRLAVERPVTTDMIYSALVLLGIIVLVLLPRELFPTVSFPQIVIVTHYGSAAPEEIENIITKLIEEQAGTIPKLKKVRSLSREGLSAVILEFNWGTDMGLAQLSVREKLDLIKDRLPTEAEEPIAQSYNPFTQPMMVLSVSGDLNISDVTRISNDVIKKRLQKVDGVGSATVSGGQQREILVEVDLGKMQASNISISGIVDSLKSSNINYPAGSTQGRFYEYLIRTIGEYRQVSDIEKTVVAVDTSRESAEYQYRSYNQPKGAEAFQPKAQRLIPLGSIAEVKDTFRDAESYSRHNGRPNVSVAIQKQYDANAIKTAVKVRQTLKELTVSLPKEMKVDIIYDESIFIKKALTDVTHEAVAGGVLAFLVLLFFLRSARDALIITLSLPISMLVVFIVLYFMGRTINVIALAGLSLGIGSITDNAIAVLDNIVRYRGKISEPRESAIAATSEIVGPQIASMLTNVVVFLPMLFATGVAQQLFKDLFIAAVVSNIAALFVAITLVPRVASAFSFSPAEGVEADPAGAQNSAERTDLSAPGDSDEDVVIGAGGVKRVQSSADLREGNPGEDPESGPDGAIRHQVRFEGPDGDQGQGGSNPFKRFFMFFAEGLTPERYGKMHQFYQGRLIWALQNRSKVVAAALVLFVASLGIFYFKDKVFMPQVDQGQFVIRLNMPVGTRLDVTNGNIAKIEEFLAQVPEIKDVLVRVGADRGESIDALGSHQGECIVTLDRENYSISTEKVILKIKDKLKSVNFEGGDLEYILQGSSFKGIGSGTAPIAITIKGPNMDALKKISEEMQLAIKKIEGITGVKTSLAEPSYETRVSIDKDRSSGFGLSVSDIARASLIAIHGFVGTYFKEEGKEIPIRVRLRERDRNDPVAIQRISIRTQQGFMVPLGDVASISAGYGPSEIQRIDQQRAVVVSAQVFGRSVGDVIQDVDRAMASYQKPKDYTMFLGGAKQEMQESLSGLIIAFILAVLLIYMIMASGFESLLHPFLIMFTVPLGVIGVAFTVLITTIPVSAPVVLALILLGGIVVCNGIVLIEHINELRQEGRGLFEATLEGCTDRLRPILMTALVAVLALLPNAVGTGQGTELSAPMAIATLGGLFISTMLTLLVLPIIYVSVEERLEAKRQRHPSEIQGE